MSNSRKPLDIISARIQSEATDKAKTEASEIIDKIKKILEYDFKMDESRRKVPYKELKIHDDSSVREYMNEARAGVQYNLIPYYHLSSFLCQKHDKDNKWTLFGVLSECLKQIYIEEKTNKLLSTLDKYNSEFEIFDKDD